MTDIEKHSALIARSLRVIRAGQAASGAYVAAPYFPTYRFSWFRDGSFIADAMSRCGDPDSAAAFYRWCARIMTDRASRIERLVGRGTAHASSVSSVEHLHTRYTLDGEESPTEWENFQLDGYGMWIWSLDGHLDRHGGDRQPYVRGVALTVDYLVMFWDSPCYDWWEEHGDARHPSTLAAIRAGLSCASTWPELAARQRESAEKTVVAIDELIRNKAIVDGHLTKSLGSTAVDASLLACMVPFGAVRHDDPVALKTVRLIEEQLAPAGVHRYLTDTYYGGGQWPLLTALLGWQYARAGDTARARDLLDWIAEQADEELNLPEQVATGALHPEYIDEWVDRWGTSANPLLWSHAMYLTLAHELGVVEAAEVRHPDLRDSVAPDPATVRGAAT